MAEIPGIDDLILQFLKGELSPEEKEKLYEWIAQSNDNRMLFNRLTDKGELCAELLNYRKLSPEETRIEKAKVEEKIFSPEGIAKISWRTSRLRYMVAAAVLVVMLGSAYLLLFDINNKSVQKTVSGDPAKNEILPGQTKARLVLADGTAVLLDSVKHGQLSVQGNAVIENRSGHLLYKVNKGEKVGSALLYNTLLTERGETYATMLSDGSKVWINAQSSLHYPVVFEGKDRVVELKGEGYFEIASDKSKPFKVIVGDKIIEALGTRFAVNAYSDEQAVKTSLLEGKVKVSINNKSQILSPGQILTIDKKENLNLYVDSEVDGEIAWIKGLFYFSNRDLHSVLLQLSRWYSVDIEYHDIKEIGAFTGYISRKIPVGEVLDNIAGMVPVKFEIRNRTVHVYPKK